MPASACSSGERPLDTAGVAALAALRTRSVRAMRPAARVRGAAPLDALAARALERRRRACCRLDRHRLWVRRCCASCRMIYLGEVAELKRIESQDGGRVVASAPARRSKTPTRRCETLAEPREGVAFRLGADPQCRNDWAATSPTGSPIGDGAPVLMALDASVELRRGGAVRRLPLADFYIGYMKNRLEPGEFVEAHARPLDGAAVRSAPTRSRSASTPTSRRSAPRSRSSSTATSFAAHASPSAAWRRRYAAPRAAEAAVVGEPVERSNARARAQRELATSSSRSTTCVPAPRTEPGSRRTCCGGYGSRRGASRGPAQRPQP
jgi:xanthine dehydrogenase small subunit